MRQLTDADLADTVRALCASLDASRFPGVASLAEIRQVVDVLDHELGRREKATAEHQIRPDE